MSAPKFELSNFVVIVDNNGGQTLHLNGQN